MEYRQIWEPSVLVNWKKAWLEENSHGYLYGNMNGRMDHSEFMNTEYRKVFELFMK